MRDRAEHTLLLAQTPGGSASSPESPTFVPVGSFEVSRATVLRINLGGEVVAELDLPADETVIRDVLRAAASL